MSDDECNFQKIHDDFRPMNLRYLTRMVGENEAENLTQEVFARIDRALKAFRGESSLSTWIYQIATNVATDRLRRPSARHGDEKRLPIEDIAETEEDKDTWTGEQAPSTDQRVIREEMNGCVREIIKTLPDTYRSVIVLSELEGFKDAEIADILGLSLQAAKIRLHRARTRLREELKTACIFYRDEHNEFACDRKTPFIKKIGEITSKTDS
ncbi:MAG: sigma-70 family RNA polymerase sigma factor [Deltaproteobacteria bacterium]